MPASIGDMGAQIGLQDVGLLHAEPPNKFLVEVKASETTTCLQIVVGISKGHCKSICSSNYCPLAVSFYGVTTGGLPQTLRQYIHMSRMSTDLNAIVFCFSIALVTMMLPAVCAVDQ